MFNARNTQLALKTKGYYSGAVDGDLGPKTLAALMAIAGLHRPEMVPLAAPLGEYLDTGLDKAEINTPIRLAHFLAQTACETAAFTRLKENDGGDPHYFDRYEGNKTLGNTQPGDGSRFCGRGLLDTTGRWNYQHLHDISGIDCVNHPEILQQPMYASQSALAYWSSRSINKAADANDIDRVTMLVNGGLNGLSDRKIFLGRLNSVIKP